VRVSTGSETECCAEQQEGRQGLEVVKGEGFANVRWIDAVVLCFAAAGYGWPRCSRSCVGCAIEV
jgi:hypothetical protein